MEKGESHLHVVPQPPTSSLDIQDTSPGFVLSPEVTDIPTDLNDQERDVLRLRFGLDIGRPRSFEETGKLLGMLPPSVRVVEVEAFKKLRED